MAKQDGEDPKPRGSRPRAAAQRFVHAGGTNGTGGGKKRRLSFDTLQDLVETIAAKTEANHRALERIESRFDSHTTAEEADRGNLNTRLDAIHSMLGDLIARLPDERQSKEAAPPSSQSSDEEQEES